MIQIDINKPTNCDDCPFCVDYDCIIHKRVTHEYYDSSQEQYWHCPLIEPEPNGWIPITEEMPDADEEVLVTREYKCKKYVEEACLLYGEWISYSDEYKSGLRRDHKVLAWMPKPSPYQEES